MQLKMFVKVSFTDFVISEAVQCNSVNFTPFDVARPDCGRAGERYAHLKLVLVVRRD